MASKIFLSQLSQEVIDFIENNSGSGGGSSALLKEIISNVTVGAAPAGTVFPKSLDLTNFAEKILLKDIVPTITTTFSNSGLKEKGTVIHSVTMTLKIDNLKNLTVEVNQINFYDGNTLITSLPFEKGKDNYSYTYIKDFSENKTLKAELIYNTDSKVFGTGLYNFVYASYYGATDKATITNQDATDFANTFSKSIKSTKAFTWNNITLQDERFCYMYPVSFGTLTSIKDGNGFSQIDGYMRQTVTITSPADNKPVQYYVYLLKDPTTGSGFTQIYS